MKLSPHPSPPWPSADCQHPPLIGQRLSTWVGGVGGTPTGVRKEGKRRKKKSFSLSPCLVASSEEEEEASPIARGGMDKRTAVPTEKKGEGDSPHFVTFVIAQKVKTGSEEVASIVPT